MTPTKVLEAYAFLLTQTHRQIDSSFLNPSKGTFVFGSNDHKIGFISTPLEENFLSQVCFFFLRLYKTLPTVCSEVTLSAALFWGQAELGFLGVFRN